MNFKSSVVTIGNFDGVHLGHRAIVSKLLEFSGKLHAPSVAMTFHPHPSQILGRPSPPLLTSPEERSELMRGLGVEHFVIQPFTSELANRSAREFVKELLIQKYRMRAMVIGPTTHVGKGREGTPERIQELAKELGFELHIVAPVELEGGIVSSSRIRKELENGNVPTASHLLGRYHRNSGTVVKGKGRGKTLLFPTANVEVPTEMQLPKNGVYSTWFIRKGARLPSVTNVGVRPTFESQGLRTVESHILDFSGSLSGEVVTLEWVGRIRDEKRFTSAEELRNQIQKDVLRARTSLAEPL
jgi:riboflavin kinase / FMN adenylyltransferase